MKWEKHEYVEQKAPLFLPRKKSAFNPLLFVSCSSRVQISSSCPTMNAQVLMCLEYGVNIGVK